MTLKADAQQIAWLAAKLPMHTEFQVWTCHRRRGKTFWSLTSRCADEETATHWAKSNSDEGKFVSVLKVTINPPPMHGPETLPI